MLNRYSITDACFCQLFVVYYNMHSRQNTEHLCSMRARRLSNEIRAKLIVSVIKMFMVAIPFCDQHNVRSTDCNGPVIVWMYTAVLSHELWTIFHLTCSKLNEWNACANCAKISVEQKSRRKWIYNTKANRQPDKQAMIEINITINRILNAYMVTQLEIYKKIKKKTEIIQDNISPPLR